MQIVHRNVWFKRKGTKATQTQQTVVFHRYVCFKCDCFKDSKEPTTKQHFYSLAPLLTTRLRVAGIIHIIYIHTHIHTYIYIYTHTHLYIYIYIRIERERASYSMA